MTDTLIVAVISLFGTLAGTFGGILTSSKLTGYRIEQLEKKMEKHYDLTNNLVERVYRLEEAHKILDEKMSVANHRISDLEKASAQN
jgi:aromatic ring-opening dioxygenase LigB subunit